MTAVVIGLDIGTTAAKVVAFPVGGGWRHGTAVEYPLLRPQSGWRVQDPATVLAATTRALREVVDHLTRARPEAEVVAVSVSTAMHGLVGLDADLTPITPVVTWADARARDVARVLRADPRAPALHASSGTPVHSMSPLTKLRWFATTEPELVSRVRVWADLKALVLHALTGRVATEVSSASGWGLLRLATREWDPEAAVVAGVRLDQLPEILPTTAALPLDAAVARHVGLTPGLPVVTGGADGPLGNLGTGALAPGVAGLSLGTSGALRLVVDEPYADPTGRLFCYHLADDLWVVGTPISNGGAVVRWAASVFAASDGEGGGVADDATVLALADSVPPGSEGLVMLPFLLAERGPLWDADLRGAFLGLRQHHTRGHFVRAAVEGVALQLSTILDGLDEVVPVTQVRATGGVFRSDLWRRVLAGTLGRPLVVTDGAEGSALGAAALGWYAVGRTRSLEAAVENLSPGILAASDAERLVASPADAAAYEQARLAAAERLRALQASAEPPRQQAATRGRLRPPGPLLDVVHPHPKPTENKESQMSSIQEIRREFVEEKLPVRSVLGYGFGDFANNLAFTLSTAFLLYYYTDVAGLTAASVATLFFVVRLWDAFADVFAGRLVDRTMTRWGKFRPFLLFGAVPLLFLSYLTFHVPADLSQGSKLLYAYLTYAVLGLVYSLVNIPYGSLASAMSQSVNERAKLVSSRFFGGAVGGLLLTFIIAPQVSSLRKVKDTLSPQEYADRAQGIFTTTTLAFIVIGTLAYLVVFFTAKEKVLRTEARVSLRDTWATLRTNKPLGYLCAASFFYLIGLFAVGGASAYYAQYVLGDIKYLVHVTVVNSGASILLAPFIPKLVDRFGKTRLFQWCGVLTVLGGLGIFFVPTGALAPALLFLAIKGFGAALINTLMFGLEADTVEYGEWRTGKRSEGSTYALFSFTRKITQSIGGALGAAALAFGGYISATKAVPNPVQPESAIVAIRIVMGLLPMAAALIAMAIFSRYPLTDERFREIRDETELRKQQQGHLIAGDGHVID